MLLLLLLLLAGSKEVTHASGIIAVVSVSLASLLARPLARLRSITHLCLPKEAFVTTQANHAHCAGEGGPRPTNIVVTLFCCPALR